MSLLRYRLLEDAIDLFVDRFDGRLIRLRERQRLVRSALRAGSGRGGGVGGRLCSSGLAGRLCRIGLQFAYLGFQVIDLRLNRLQIGAAREND